MKLGDVVRLKGDPINPKMTISLLVGDFKEPMALCMWFVDSNLHKQYFTLESLNEVP